ncbi:MAG: ABC transporter permease [Nitrososphaerales archaeon]
MSYPPVYVRLSETLRITVLAFFSAIIIGSGIGLIIGGIGVLKSALEPYVVLANSIPRAIFVPLFWAYFGVGDNYRFFFALVSSTIPVIINVMYALRSVDPQLIRVASAFGASVRQTYSKLIVPTIIPAILGAARLSFNLAFGGVIIAEEFQGSFGVGDLAVNYANGFQSSDTISLYSLVVAIALIAVSVNVALLLLEKWYLRWNRP